MQSSFVPVVQRKVSWLRSGRPYRDRTEAGEVLAAELESYRGAAGVLVLALPRGGVPVAAAIARELGAELDVMVVRKLGVPGHEELAMGAVASGGVKAINSDIVEALGILREELDEAVEREIAEVARREAVFRGVRPPAAILGKTVILVDDGLATGATMRAAIAAVRAHGPREIVVAVPVAPEDTLRSIRRAANKVVCPLIPAEFSAVGQFYADFSQVSTVEARKLLEEAHQPNHEAVGEAPSKHALHRGKVVRSEVEIPVPGSAILATLAVPEDARGVIAFAHGSGSSRFSARNGFVARVLESRGFATLLVDLLTLSEEVADRADGRWRFDIPLLAERVVSVVDWLERDARTAGLRLGLFGASTGAAAALVAAGERPLLVRAVVSRGGRPDLAPSSLPLVRAPTLLIVGGNDGTVLDLNRAASERMLAGHRLEVIPGATHLFEEPGTLEAVAELAADFFDRHLTKRVRESPSP